MPGLVIYLEEKKLNNCLHCRRGIPSLFFTDFVYFDLRDEGLSTQMLFDNKVRVWKLKKAKHPGEPYEMYLARIWKGDVVKFVDVMSRLEKRILFAGHGDYVDYCKKVFDRFRKNRFEAPEGN